jgi:hypothetical protein
MSDNCKQCICRTCLRKIPQGDSSDCYNCEMCSGNECDTVIICKNKMDAQCDVDAIWVLFKTSAECGEFINFERCKPCSSKTCEVKRQQTV